MTSKINAQEIGSGPIVLSKTAKIFLEQYLDKPEPIVFVVSNNGRYAYYYHCPEAFCEDLGDYQTSAIAECEEGIAKRGIKATCRVFAIEDKIVWKGPVKNLPGSISGNNEQQGIQISDERKKMFRLNKSWEQWNRDAANGDKDSLFHVAFTYWKSDRPNSNIYAYAFFTLSGSIWNRDQVATKMTKNEVIKAEDLIRELKDKNPALNNVR